MARSRKAWLGWILAMLFVPPVVALLAAMACAWSDTGFVIGMSLYAASMIGMAVGASVTLTTGTATRWGMFFVFAIGMVFVQCAVFFAGCSAIVGVLSIRS